MMWCLPPLRNHAIHQRISSRLAQKLTQMPVYNHQRTADRGLSVKQRLRLISVRVAQLENADAELREGIFSASRIFGLSSAMASMVSRSGSECGPDSDP